MFAFARAWAASRAIGAPALTAVAALGVQFKPLAPNSSESRENWWRFKRTLCPTAWGVSVRSPAHCVIDGTLEKLLNKFDVPKDFAS